MKNEKLLCKHCNTHIANKHIMASGYHGNAVIKPLQGSITKTGISGVSKSINRFSNDVVGYFVSIQIKCKKCEKHTTFTFEQYNEATVDELDW